MTTIAKNVLTAVLVGMHFRPPAKLILETLPAGAELQLVHEADNPYDGDAVRVYVRLSAVPASQLARLEAELPGFGWSIEEFHQRIELGEAFQLGYLAAGKNKVLKGQEELVSNSIFLAAQEQVSWSECQISLGFSPSGLPLVVLRAP